MLFITSSFLKDYSVDGFALELLESLEVKHVDFRVSSNALIGQPFPDKFKSKIAQRTSNDFQLLINPACFLSHFGVDKKTILYTVWDSTMVPTEYVQEVNKARLCLVPSEETKRIFQNSGVNIPIEVLNHWYDSYNLYSNPIYSKEYTFGSAGQICEDPRLDKKNMVNLIESFQSAFQGNENVKLRIKTSCSSNDIPCSDPRVEILKKDLTIQEMNTWYNSLDQYVNVSRYESYGRHMLEALGCGVPLITTAVGGPVEYLQHVPNLYRSIGHQTVYNRNPGSIYSKGYWYEPNCDELISVMKHVYKRSPKSSNALSLYNSSFNEVETQFGYIKDNFGKYALRNKYIKVLSRFTHGD